MSFAVIAAGGAGARMGGRAPKFQLELAGKPMVLYSLEALEEAASVEGVTLVVPADRLDEWRALPGLARLAKVRSVVPGGASRQESVAAGLDSVPAGTEVVLVHDAARPLVTSSLIDRVSAIPEGFDGAVAAVRLTDTVKEVEGDLVKATLRRERLVSVQTPQAFRYEILLAAHRAAAAQGFEGTDDSSLVERAGGRVAVVEGSRENLKVTFPEDLDTARELLERRRG